MENLSVSERLPAGCAVQYTPGLYNSDTFLEANNSLPQLHFYLIDADQHSALGHIAFSIEEGEAMSPYKAPFAGFELAPDLDSLSCLYFLQEIQRRLKERSIRYFKIKIAPACYVPGNLPLADNMRHLGFEEKERQIYHAIMVNEQPLTMKIATMEQRKLRKALKEKLSFRFARRSEYPVFFDFIKRHREAKGHQLSMDWNEMKGGIRANPEGYLAVGVFKEEDLIAASVLIRVSEKVVYNFFPAHDAGYNALSPMVCLIDSVYAWCQEQGVAWIDLGTSYLGKKKNKSLISFKEHMGGQPFESITFRKTLSL
ncbi:MAG: GNAT family N-acetyltransferase [Roseivirga sp.]|nr:GNAT family N-acetyltransferase [Roseivirga sp.]